MSPAFELPRIETVEGRSGGPVLAVLGGVHGDEYEGVLAVRRLADRLAGTDFRGRVVYAAPAHPAAWCASSRESPIDGGNLARVFPGRPDGNATERVAWHLTRNLIAGADLVIDLHSAGRSFDMPLLVGFHSTGPLADRAEAAAQAFAAPHLWRHPEASVGRSLSAAEGLGIPAIYAESRGGGRLRQRDLDAYVDGVLRVMAHLEMLTIDGAPAPDVTSPLDVVGDGNTDEGMRAPTGGFFVTAVGIGRHVVAGEVIGVVADDRGAPCATIRAPHDGIVMLLRRTVEVDAGDTLAIIASRSDRVQVSRSVGADSGQIEVPQ